MYTTACMHTQTHTHTYSYEEPDNVMNIFKLLITFL